MTPEEQAAIRQWAAILDAVDAGRSIVTDGKGTAALKSIGGKTAIKNRDAGRVQWLKRDFVDAYRALDPVRTPTRRPEPRKLPPRDAWDLPMESPHPMVPVPATTYAGTGHPDNYWYWFRRLSPRAQVDVIMWRWWHSSILDQHTANTGIPPEDKQGARVPLHTEVLEARRQLEGKYQVPQPQRLVPQPVRGGLPKGDE